MRNNKDFYELMAEQGKLDQVYTMPIKAIMAGIPTVGASIDAIISSKQAEYKEKRIKELFYFLKAALDKVEENKIDKEWVESEEFFDLLRNAVESSTKSRSIEKIKMNAMILSNVLTIENKENYRPEEYLAILSELTTQECKALLVVYERFESLKGVDGNDIELSRRAGWKEAIIEKCSIDKADLDFIMKRLERTGFIKEITGARFSYTGGEYYVTGTFEKFMEYLKLNPLLKDDYK
ncbi:TPA: hypothetical protein QCQ90_002168 [Bacillus cereus]|nr:hypothetical protein [Bacillus cereus]HDR4620439.1 hypothetical protein [Bacillus cereus]